MKKLFNQVEINLLQQIDFDSNETKQELVLIHREIGLLKKQDGVGKDGISEQLDSHSKRIYEKLDSFLPEVGDMQKKGNLVEQLCKDVQVVTRELQTLRPEVDMFRKKTDQINQLEADQIIKTADMDQIRKELIAMKQKANLIEQLDVKTRQMEQIRSDITTLRDSQNAHFEKLLNDHKAHQVLISDQQQGITQVKNKTSLIDQMRKDVDGFRQNISKLQAGQDDI